MCKNSQYSKGFFTKYGLGRGRKDRGSRSNRELRINRRLEVIELQDSITTLIEILNYSNENKTSINISYETLIKCNLYELEYWDLRAKELLDEAEKRAENSG